MFVVAVVSGKFQGFIDGFGMKSHPVMLKAIDGNEFMYSSHRFSSGLCAFQHIDVVGLIHAYRRQGHHLRKFPVR